MEGRIPVLPPVLVTERKGTKIGTQALRFGNGRSSARPNLKKHENGEQILQMTTILNLNTKQAREAPDTVFARPLDVVSQLGLTRGQKIAALERWRETLEDQLRATDEGMVPPAGQTAREAATVEEIGTALRLVLDRREQNEAAPGDA